MTGRPGPASQLHCIRGACENSFDETSPWLSSGGYAPSHYAFPYLYTHGWRFPNLESLEGR